MAAGRAQALTNLFNALDRVPADRRGTAIAAAEKYLQEIRRLEAAGATPEEIKAAGTGSGQNIRVLQNANKC